MINVRTIKKLTNNEGLTIKAVRMMKGNCGVWYSDGVYYIDHSFRVDTKREAMSIGRAHNQISILCWKTMGLAYC